LTATGRKMPVAVKKFQNIKSYFQGGENLGASSLMGEICIVPKTPEDRRT
jgi:hypothetical protein